MAVPFANFRAELLSDRVGNYQYHPFWGTSRTTGSGLLTGEVKSILVGFVID